MTLLSVDRNLEDLAKKVYDRQFELDPQLDHEFDERQKKLMFSDILYNLSFLNTAIKFDDDQIFVDYAIWIYQLMCNLMKNLDRVRIKDQMISHYQILGQALSDTMPANLAEKAHHHLQNAIEVTKKESIRFTKTDRFENPTYREIKQEYLSSLLRNDTRKAIAIIEQAAKSGIPLEKIYLNIVQEVMYEVGNLWHQQAISVDKEHYITSATQMALSQFYPVIFSRPRNGFKLLACSVGSELHEMGARMISDLFEYNGWESTYLGAAVPNDAVIKAIEEIKPDLVALSVTMPQHLPICFDAVNAIRARFKDIKISVGGRAFQTTNELWKKWDVNISTTNAEELVEWAEKNIVKVG